jgi:hypothetical protein
MRKLLVQWSLSEPEDFEEITIGEWRAQPKRPVPKGGEAINHEKGYIYDLIVDGVTFGSYDHYAVEPAPGNGIKVTVWNDDIEDGWEPIGSVWVFRPHRRDPKHGQWTTNQTVVRYGYPEIETYSSGGKVEYRPWSEFPMPDEAVVRHGIWLDEDLFRAHWNKQRPYGWQEWD